LIESAFVLSDAAQDEFNREGAILKGLHKQTEEPDYEKTERKRIQRRQQRLLANPNGVREDFWRGSEKTDLDVLKQELIQKKIDLQTKQQQERKEHN
jgi:hypothetical protein